jgi:hypothetical protein
MAMTAASTARIVGVLILAQMALAAFGLAAVALQIIAVAMPLFGYRVIFLLLAPLGVSQLVLALWLITKGFREPDTGPSGSHLAT